MFLEKYEPRNFREFIGNREQVEEIRKWLKASKKGTLILSGPIGCGKSLAVKLLAKELGYEIVESHASDDRNKEYMGELINASKQAGIFSRKKIILLEDLEVMESKKNLSVLAKESACPVVIIAENPYELGIPSLLRTSKSVKFGKPGKEDMHRFLRNICGKENIDTDPVTLNSIVLGCDGDLRAALIDLEIYQKGSRERSANIFDAVRSVFRGEIPEDTDVHQILMWVSENIPNEFRTAQEIASAYEQLAKADLFMARIIKRQSWSLQKYVPHVLGKGMKLSRKSRLQTFTTYRPPTWTRRLNRQTAEKIATHNHVAVKDATQYMPVLKNLVDDNEFCNYMGLDEDDIEVVRNFRL